MKKVCSLIAVCLFVFASGCTKNENNNSTDVTSAKGDSENVVYPEGLPEGISVKISEAEQMLVSKLGNDDEKLFYCDCVDFINGRCYYIFRGYNNLPDHIATFGWYAVDVFTGEAYDTMTLTDLVPIK